MTFDRKTYFDSVRASLFNGTMDQSQVDGQEAILSAWETYVPNHDVRWLANFLAQSAHETGFKMIAVEEYKGAEQPYGQIDPQTGQRYYGRGLIQITHRENYRRTDDELQLSGDASCEYHADNMMKPTVSARAGYTGMWEGWFRKDSMGAQTLPRYFNASVNDSFGAREIVNGDKNTVPSWSNGVSIGNLIKDYHNKFMDALTEAYVDPEEGDDTKTVTVIINAPPGVHVDVQVLEDD